MASSSRRTTTNSAGNHWRPQDVDHDTSLLFSHLTLEENKASGSRYRNKAREISSFDEDLALQLQLEATAEEFRRVDDHNMAMNLHNALAVGQDVLQAYDVLEEAAQDNHQAALASIHGLHIPPAFDWQRMLQAPATRYERMPSLNMNEEMTRGPTSSYSERTHVDGGHAPRAVPIVESSSSRTIDPSDRQEEQECVGCMDRADRYTAYHAPCGHYYCRSCLKNLVESCTRDESLFPLRCCQQNFVVDDVILWISFALAMLFRDKSKEFSVPANRRIYCPISQCSTFLGSSERLNRDTRCQECWTLVCTRCKEVVHPGEQCGEDRALVEVRNLAASKGWQSCPECHAIVELSYGCFHMTCTCRAQFCYLCAFPWKTCACPQWGDDRLIQTARERVANEVGHRGVVAAPLAYKDLLHERVEELRVNYACPAHLWAYRHGGGVCGQCNSHFPGYLMRCQRCQMLACRTCTMNRY